MKKAKYPVHVRDKGATVAQKMCQVGIPVACIWLLLLAAAAVVLVGAVLHGLCVFLFCLFVVGSCEIVYCIWCCFLWFCLFSRFFLFLRVFCFVVLPLW